MRGRNRLTSFRLATLVALLVLLGTAASGWAPGTAGATAQTGSVVLDDGRVYDAYVPAALKQGQYYYYTCEFDAAWVVLNTFGHEVPFEEQLAIVGHDLSIEPYYEQTPTGFVIYGGDITAAFSGDYAHNLLARTTGRAMRPLFERYGLEVVPVLTRPGIEATLDEGGLVWLKGTVDFLPFEPITWITPSGEELPGVLGNDHAVVVMGYNADVVLIRAVLGPTDTNWARPYEYEVPWPTFLAGLGAQGFDGLTGAPDLDLREEGEQDDAPPPIQPVDVTGST